MSKDAFYFKHDSNARNDEKILALRRKFGMEGYGIYWCIIEKMRENADYRIMADYTAISWDLRCKEQTVQSVVEDFGLFDLEDGYITSNRLREDMRRWDAKRAMCIEAGRRGMQSRWKKSEEQQPQQDTQEQPPLELSAEPPKSPAETRKPRQKKYTDEQSALHSRCKEIFGNYYRQAKGAEFIWSAKEMKMLVDVVGKVKSQMTASGHDSNDLDLVATNFEAFTKMMFVRADAWVIANASPTVMSTKFNEIYTQIKNHTNNGNQPTATNSGNARDNADFLAALFGGVQPGTAQ